ncbi:MAG: SRPBCC domain-containing protein [Burkholderiales bacterium]|nr:SRPBCC domain-containing protein [Burkholderiales bacterium]
MTPIATPADTEQALVLRRVFDAPPQTVFRLWSDPARVKEWWHPKDFTTPTFEMDFREGGAYRYSIRSEKNHGWAHGVYREIDAPNRLVMSFQWETGDVAHDQPTLITITFEAEGEGKTLLTFRQEPFSSEGERLSHGAGWGQVLDAFAQVLAGANS